MGFKADGVNLTEIRETALGSLGGSQPRSIRKRGYHRALKRGEVWALSQKATFDMINNIIVDLYCPVYNAYILTDNPLLGLSKWLPDPIHAQQNVFFGTDRTSVPVRFLPRPSLWSRIKTFLKL